MKKNKTDWNIAYFGTPIFSTFVLEELEKASILPSVVVTQPDKPAGRNLELTSPPVKAWALEKGIPTIQPETLSRNDPALDFLWNGEWDLFIVAAYGKLIPKDVLALPRRGTLNVHPSLLPRFRGPSPIESQILTDEKEIGVSIIVLDEKMDHGPIVAQASITPEPWPVRTRDLEHILWHAGGELLVDAIPPWMEETLTPEPQNHAQATYTEKMKKEDGLLDLAGDPYQNYLKFCAYDEWPGTYFFVEKNGKKIRLKITDAEFAEGVFRILKVVPEGKKEIDYGIFCNQQHE